MEIQRAGRHGQKCEQAERLSGVLFRAHQHESRYEDYSAAHAHAAYYAERCAYECFQHYFLLSCFKIFVI